MERYLYILSEIPAEHRPLFEALNAAIRRAFEKAARGDTSLTRTPIGYLLVVSGELVEIEQLSTDFARSLWGWWLARERSGKWYSDPYPTIAALRRVLVKEQE